MQPSQKLDISPDKAKKILKDDEVRGHPLTPAQKGMFGAKAGEDSPTKNAAVGTTEGDTEAEGMSCPHCGGPAEPLGNLGNLTHYRCRNCGGQFATHNESFSGFKRPKKEKEHEGPEKLSRMPQAEVRSIGNEKPVKNFAFLAPLAEAAAPAIASALGSAASQNN